MEELLKEILKDLTIELKDDSNYDSDILSVKIKGAIRDVMGRRRYQAHHTKEFIKDDMNNYYSNIKRLSLYDYNQAGVEGQTSHSENGINRSWSEREKCLDGIVPFAKVL
ncbi:hypothetical protein LI010_19955 [Enterocloster aldenensis]|uniref:hypothetical protein n=1 Tax=Enterocloster aldenensis TaxID=358742 RepID=UPI001D05F516|nr:hypothetical protein [Enterocloster aldenensis]